MERYKPSTCAVPTGVRYIREYFDEGLLPQYIVSPGCGYLSVPMFAILGSAQRSFDSEDEESLAFATVVSITASLRALKGQRTKHHH